MRIDRDMRVVVEILAIGVAVIGLQDGQRVRARRVSGVRRSRVPDERLLRDVFEQVAGERVIDRAVGDAPDRSPVRRSASTPGRETCSRNAVPQVERDTPPRDDIVDEIAVARAEVQHAVVPADTIGESNSATAPARPRRAWDPRSAATSWYPPIMLSAVQPNTSP